MTSIVVGKDRISLIESERYVAGTQNVYLMKVSFSEDWEGLEKKLVFRTDEFEMAVEIITCSEQFPIPSEIFYKPSNKLQVGCYASKCGETTLNTRWLSLGRIVKGTLNTDCICGCQPPSKPSPDTYKVLRELIDRKADRLTFEDGQFILWAGDDPLSSFDAPIALPSGGSAGQLLAKASDEEGDYEWKTVTTDLSLRLPLGSIQIWSGSIDSIPEGFSLCDGQNGTQDLRAAMIVGASDTIEPGTIFDDQPTPMNLEAPDTPSEPTEPIEHPPIRYYALAFIQKTSLTELDKKQGQNAYDIAVENGFEGTEEEWLKSLNGKSAYEIAVENGFEGTEEEWIDQLETSGTPVVKDLTISTKAEIPEPGFGAFIFDNTTVSVKQTSKARAKANNLSFAHNYVYVNADDPSKLVFTTLDNKVYECSLNDAGEITSIEEVAISGEGSKGEPGDSAYQVAVNNGFEGTETEWLDSLKGKSAYEIAVENGYEGTEEEWFNKIQNRTAEDTSYDNSTSGLAATTVQAAIDELKTAIGNEESKALIKQVKDQTLTILSEFEAAGLTTYAGSIRFTNTTITAKKNNDDTIDNTTFVDDFAYLSLTGDTLQLYTMDGIHKSYKFTWDGKLRLFTTESAFYNNSEGLKGDKGDPGDSAYQIAVSNGFTGTEVEWLASLKGADGKSAYQVAVDNGFTGTEEEWLESLKGSGAATDPNAIPVLKDKDIRTKAALTENGLMGETGTLHVIYVTFGNGQTINFKNDYIYFEATDSYFAVMTLDGVKAVYRYDESGNMLWDKFVNAYDKTADNVTYDDTSTTLDATTVQDAIVKLNEAVKDNTFTKTIEGKIIKTKEQLTEVGLWPMFFGTVRMKDVVFVEGVNRIVNFADDFVYIESWNQKPTVVLFTLKGNRITLAFDESDNIVKQSIDDAYAGDGSGSGTPGADGKSAYEIAVANGFSGTETEWLASLKGADGKSAYQIAVENGYEGSEEQWIAEIQNRNAEDISYDDSTTNLGATTIQEAIVKLDEAIKSDTPVKTIKGEVITTRDRASALGLIPYSGTIRAINTTFGSVGNIVFTDDYIYIKTSTAVFYVYTIDGVRTKFTYDDTGAFVRESRDDAYTSGSGSGTPGEDGKSAYQIAVENGFEGSEEDWLASLVGPPGADGTDGTDGKSAYQLAVEAGFNGSEAEWLASLKGADGDPGPEGTSAYQLAVDKGFTGTEEEWLASLKGLQGNPGTNGKSAYQLAQDAGFTGTEEEWLASLKGATGAKGKSAYQLAVDAGFEGDEASWLASLKGEPGPAGADGKSTYDIAVEEGFEGTQSEWLETAKGPKGDNGKSAYELAVENGYEGTVNQWLESLKGEGIAEFITYADQTITSRDVLVSIDSAKVAHFERCKLAAADGNSVTLNDELLFIEPADLTLKGYRANGEVIDLSFGEDEVFTTLTVSKGESITDLFVPITDEQIESLFT